MTVAIADHDAVINFLRGNLLGYCAAMFPGFRPGRHHKLLASKLEEVETGRLKRLCITMAPRHGKSKLATELFPTWYLGRDPKRRVLSLSYGQDLADVFGRSVRNYLKTPTFAALFPDCKLSSRLGRELAYCLSLLQRFTLVSPFEGFSHCAIEVINEFKDASFELRLTNEIGASE